MPPKRTRAHSPPVMRPTKRKNLRNIDLFLDEEAEEASSGHNSEGNDGSQKSEYSLAHLGESTLTEEEDDDLANSNGDVAGTTELTLPEPVVHATTASVPDDLDTVHPEAKSLAAAADPGAALVLSESTFDAVPATAATATVSPPIVTYVPAIVDKPPARVDESPIARTLDTKIQVTVAKPLPVANTSPLVSSSPVGNSSVTGNSSVAGNSSAAGNSSVAGNSFTTGNSSATANSSVTANLSSSPVAPTVPGLDPNVNWGYGPKLNKRINRLLTYSNDDELIYDIVHVPANAQIAAIEDTNGDETYLLTVPGRKAPITIWLIGTITRAYFRDRDGNLPKSISVNVRALHESSLNAANNLLRTFTTFGPGENPERHDTVRASRWMNTRRAGDIADHIEEFRAVYDAKHAFLSPRTRMATVFPSDIKKGDLVLLELNLGRYRKAIDNDATSSKSSPNRRKGAKSDAWTAFFALKSVCLLDDTPKKNDSTTDVQTGTWEL